MVVAKVVSHKDLQRKMILALEEFAHFEAIDVRHQAGILDVTRTREEETIFAASDRIAAIIESLDIDVSRRTGKRIDGQPNEVRTNDAFPAARKSPGRRPHVALRYSSHVFFAR